MAISDKSRKNLWAKSGNRCAICKTELFAKDESENEFNIGEECHIISKKDTGPRHKEGLSDYDHHSNLLLLCRNHHKEVDELMDTFTEDLLNYIKINHENWVRKSLSKSIEGESPEEPAFLTSIKTGAQLLNTLRSTLATSIDFDEVRTQEESVIVGGASQTLTEYLDILEIVEPGDIPGLSLQMKEFIESLESKGFLLFGQRQVRSIQVGSKSEKIDVANFAIKRIDSPDIIAL
ncbi:MAG: hypothetical protein ACI9J3_000030 [Parvicellaceae bacterium]|jgi:hypothetical protein